MMRARAACATELGPDCLIQRIGRDGIGRYHVYFRGCLRHAAVPQFRQYSRQTPCSSKTRAGSRQNGGAYVGAIGPADGYHSCQRDCPTPACPARTPA